MNAVAESRAKRLADALGAVSRPLAPLFEYAEDLQKHLEGRDEVEVLCLAALLRARAEAAKAEIARALEDLEQAAVRVVSEEASNRP